MSDDVIKGNVGITVSGNANADCIINNASKIAQYNDEQSNDSQQTVVNDSLTSLVLVIGICMIVGLVLFLLLGSGKKKKGSELSDVLAQSIIKNL